MTSCVRRSRIRNWLLVACVVTVPAALAWAELGHDAIRIIQFDDGSERERMLRELRPGGQFDREVFGKMGAEETRSAFDQKLQLRIAELALHFDFTSDQQRKLELSGQGEIKKFFDLLNATRKELRHLPPPQPDFSRFWESARSLHRSRRNVLGQDSFFDKSIRKILTAEQRQACDQRTHARQRLHYRATVDAVIGIWDGALCLSDQQRKRLTALLNEKTQPPVKGNDHSYSAVCRQAAKLPGAEFQSFLTPPQWHLLQQHFLAAQRNEPSLE